MRLSKTSVIRFSLTIGMCLLLCGGALAGGKVGIFAHHLSPNGDDAEKYSDPGWGGGLQVVAPFSQVHNLFAITFTVEITNLLNQTTEFIERPSMLRIEQQTSQNYYRFSLGGRLGAHGKGFFRPFAGAALALAVYHIGTDVVVPDDVNRENEIRQNLRDVTKSAFGFDVNFGTDLNVANSIASEVGFKYMKNFGLTQQLGAGAVDISPEYFQVYVGVGIGFDYLRKLAKDNDDS